MSAERRLIGTWQMSSVAVFSSNSDEWETPMDLFDRLDAEFHFDLDPCATKEMAKCEKFFTIEDDGLSQNWGGHRVFCNPPYSKIKDWVKKSYEESLKPHTIVVMLIPARTDTRWFHDYIYHRSEIRFIKGRLHYSNSKMNSPFPSMIVVFRAGGIT